MRVPDGKNFIVLRADHGNISGEIFQIFNAVIPVGKDQLHRQKGKERLGHGRQRVPRRNQNEPGKRHGCLSGDGGGYTTAQRFPQKINRLSVVFVGKAKCLQAVGDERLFAHLARTAAIQRILGQNDPETEVPQRFQIKTAVKSRSAVAVKQNDRSGCRRFVLFGNQPPVILTRSPPKGHIFRRQHGCRRPVVIGKIKKSVLHVTASQNQDDHEK